VLEELAAAQPPLRGKLLKALESVPCEILPITREQRGLASVYVQEGVIPVKYTDDAIHVAVCVLNQIDCLITWNMKHLANFRRIEQMNLINLRYGLPPIKIHTPEEML
jgi:hypothetical protein